jgi:hypothetical protein
MPMIAPFAENEVPGARVRAFPDLAPQSACLGRTYVRRCPECAAIAERQKPVAPLPAART